MRPASVYMETWGDKFIVVCNFNGLQMISNQEFKTYEEAIEEMGKQIGRELIRLGTKR